MAAPRIVTGNSTRKAGENPAPAVKPTAGSSSGRRRRAGPAYHPMVDAILAMIRSIPRGKTAAYGQVAALAGQPRGARQVARVLHSLSGAEGLPWHRVINGNGRISLPMEGAGGLQAALLRREGVAVDARGRVDAAAGAWRPKGRRGGS